MGYNLKKTKRQSGTTRIRIDLPNPREGENTVSAYIRSGEWRYVICESAGEAHDFQWYALDQLKPLLNKDFSSWDVGKTPRYQNLFHELLICELRSCDELKNMHSGPGVYAFFHKQTPNEYKNSTHQLL